MANEENTDKMGVGISSDNDQHEQKQDIEDVLMSSQESGSESPNVGSSDYSGDTEPVASDNEEEMQQKEHTEPVASDNEEEIQQKEHTVSDKQEEMQQKEHTEPVTSNNEKEKQKGDDEEEKDKSRECKHVGQDNVQLDNQKSTITDPSLDKQEKDDTNVVKSKTKNDQTTSVRQHSDSGSSDDDVSWSRPWLKWQNWRSQNKKMTLPKLTRYSSYDTEQYRQGYPDKSDDPSINDNYEFYTNRIQSHPQGDYIDEIHNKWWGNYELLEYHHSYIQWLFPIRERGLNWYAKELQPHEIDLICGDEKALNRIIKSYEMMLDFYGLQLKDRSTGEVERSSKWKQRFLNLNRSSHNNLRITRILKCLGEFRFEHYKAPLIRHFLYEAIIEKTLSNTLSSCLNYWIEVVRCDEVRESLQQYAKQLVDEFNKQFDK